MNNRKNPKRIKSVSGRKLPNGKWEMTDNYADGGSVKRPENKREAARRRSLDKEANGLHQVNRRTVSKTTTFKPNPNATRDESKRIPQRIKDSLRKKPLTPDQMREKEKKMK